MRRITGGVKIKTTEDRRSAAERATLSGIDMTWRTANEIVGRVSGYSASTVKNNLTMLVQERAVETRYAKNGRAHVYEYRLPQEAP